MLSPLQTNGAEVPYLEYFPEQGNVAHRIPIDRLPFRIGRSKAAHWTVYSSQVSKEHAEVFHKGGEFRVRDLGSTNGTFVNGERVLDAPLNNGDVLQLAHEEFRFGCECRGGRDTVPIQTDPVSSALPASISRGGDSLRQLLDRHAVHTVFQPIVRLDTWEPMGFEALGRGNYSGLSSSPLELFRLASQVKLARNLSRLFRVVGLEQAVRLPGSPRVFFNVHPSEIADGSLIESLRDVRGTFPDSHQLVMEVHENAVTDVPTMRRLRGQLEALGIELAFDDFGAGQARFLELAEAPPQFIKLDMGLTRGIEQADQRQDLIRALSRVVKDFGTQLIAEGIETVAEAHACRSLGCHFGQGFLFGRPQPVTAFLGR